MMEAKKNYMKIVKTEITVFDPPKSYEFKMVHGIKIETVESFVKRGGRIEYIGHFSDPDHLTNNPNYEVEANIIRNAS